MIKFLNVTKFYPPSTYALKNVSFYVKPGEFVSIVGQSGDFKLLPKKTVFENIAFALRAVGAPKNKIKSRISQVLKIVGLEKKATHFPHQLSAGEAQRAAIARALVCQPKILLADEPTGDLDPLNTRGIVDLLVKINEFGTTVLLVTHNREIVNLLRKRVITLEQGMIIGDQIKRGRYVV